MIITVEHPRYYNQLLDWLEKGEQDGILDFDFNIRWEW